MPPPQPMQPVDQQMYSPQPLAEPGAMYNDVIREEKLNNIIAQINPDNLMVDIENRIRGKIKDQFTNQWVDRPGNGKGINEELVRDVMSFLGAILNQNTSMSNFSSGEINSIMENVITHLSDHLIVNAERYGIKGQYTEMTRIGDIVCMTIFSVLKRAQNGMEARRTFSSLQITESLTQNPNKPKSFMETLKFWT